MVRRTKAEAEQTRHALLDAAERLFLERGVSRTTLQDIATAAGTTRGAIYWHFQDKAALFNAMMDRVTLPLEQAFLDFPDCAQANADGVLAHLLNAILNALKATAHDPQTGRVFEIAIHKVEYVSDMRPVVQRRMEAMGQFRQYIQDALERVAELSNTPLPMSAPDAAMGLCMLFDGLLENWLLDRSAFDLEAMGRTTLTNFLRGLGLVLPQQTPAAQPGARSGAGGVGV